MRISNFLFSLLLLSFCTQAQANYQFQAKTQQIEESQNFWGSFWDRLAGRKPPRSVDLTVKITNAATGEALKNVTVMVGTQKGTPFAENILKTNEAGVATFSDEKLRSGLGHAITAALPGYGTATIFAVKENSVEISLQPLPRENGFSFLQGRITGFPPGYDSGTLEIGLFMPAIRTESLLNFDPQEFVSSYKVEMDVFGKREVPGNVVLPQQSKRYGIIPIRLNKPEFIMPLPQGLETHMAASAGNVDLSTAVKAINNKDYLAVLNATTLTHVGWTNRMKVRGNERFDINASYALRQGAIGAQISGVGAKLDVIAISVIDPEGDAGDYIPLDVKSLKSEELKNGAGDFKLSILNQRAAKDRYYVFTGILNSAEIENKNKRSIVGAMLPVNKSKLSAKFSAFFQSMDMVSVSANNREFQFTPAANKSAKLIPNLTILNIISEKKNPGTMGILRSVLWTAVIPASVEKFSLPNLGKAVLPTPDASKEERFVWEVIAVKAGEDKSKGLDVQSALRNVQHVSTLTKAF